MSDERGIIIADRDVEYRDHVADFFRKAGYRVETTDSAVHVLCSILEKQTPVLLLGNDFDRKVSSVDLVHLLKKCNRHLNVIMVSDEMPLALARKVRQEGIFYHALKPASAGDTAELGQAVACAFEKNRVNARPEPASAEQELPAVDEPEDTGWFCMAKIKRALPWIFGMAALIFGMSYLSLAAAETAKTGSNVAIWVFLGFCSLIVAAQLLPIFRIKLVLDPKKRQTVRQAHLDEK